MMLNGSLESCRVTEAVWLDVARSESEKLIRSSVEALILLQWHRNLGDTREMSAEAGNVGSGMWPRIGKIMTIIVLEKLRASLCDN